jgi:Fe-S-cluster containining protein
MSAYRDKLFCAKANLICFYFLYFLFILNDKFLKSQKLENFFWDHIKTNILYIKGNCLLSGNCCQNIMLFFKSKPIRNLTELNKLTQKNPNYLRFIPNFAKDQKNINSFSCSYLTADNLCQDYENRPSFCRNYPLNLFLLGQPFPPFCGYKIALKEKLFSKIKNPRLQALINKHQKN